jgi:hypothetical protein
MSKTLAVKLLALALLAFAIVALPAGAARAQDEDPVAKITQLNRDALGAYQAKKYEDAKKLLKQALELADASGLDQHPIKARTHIHMGVVLIAGAKQRADGMKQFKKALEIQPDILLTKNLITPDLQSAFDQAATEMKNGGGDKSGGDDTEATPPAAPPPPSKAVAPPPPPKAAEPAAPDVPSGGLVHEAVTEGKQGSAISISVGVQSDLKFDKLVLAYRPAGANDFLGRTMKQVSEGTYAAEIPTSATGGRNVAYYIEAEDKDGSPVAARGSADSPLIIALVGSRPPAVAHGGGDGDNGNGNDDDDDDDDEGGGGPKIYVGLLVGSGAGWATGNGDTNADTMIKPAGLAGALIGQFAPEVGYWLRKNFMLSVQGRFQTISGPTDIYATDASGRMKVYHTANYAAAGFVKGTWRFGEGKIHPFFSLAAGGGEIRHVVTFKQIKNCGPSKMETCVDTIGGGPFIAGPGGGLMANFSDRLALVLQVNTQLAFTNFTFNVDGNVGMALSF